MNSKPHTPATARIFFRTVLLIAVCGMATAARAQIFVSQYTTSNIGIVSEYTVSGTNATAVRTLVTEPQGTPSPMGIAATASNLYMLNASAGTVDKYTISGTSITLTKAAFISGLKLPGAIAASGTTIFLSNNCQSTVGGAYLMEYSNTGTLISKTLVKGLSDPDGIAVTGTNLFVSDVYSGIVGEYTTSGAAVNASLITGIKDPAGMAISGNFLFVADPQSGTVDKYSFSGSTASAVDVPLVALSFPQFVATSGTDLFVADTDRYEASAYTLNGVALNKNLVAIRYPEAIAAIPAATVIPKLPATVLKVSGTAVAGGPLQFTATQAQAGAAVRVQYSITPAVEASWSDLADGHAGALTGSKGVYTTGTAGTTYYPAGSAVYFRAIASETGYTDSISNVLGPLSLDQAHLSISVALTSTTDPAAGATTHIGDDLTYTFTWVNQGNAPAKNLQVETPVPTYIDATSNLIYQFPKSALTFNQYGTYYAATSTGTNNAKVIWNVAALSPGYQQSLTLTVHVGSEVRIDQQLGLGNNYEVYSTIHQPPTVATGYTSGAANIGTQVDGPISFTMTPKTETVAPGGLITYVCKLSNLGSSAVANAFAMVVVPDGMRFASSYPSGTATVPSVVWANTGLVPAPAPIQNFWYGSPNPQVVIDIGSLYAHGDSKGRDSVSLDVTFQAEWIDPTTMPAITSIDYGAEFFDPSSSEYATFLSDFNASRTSTAGNPGQTNFLSFLSSGGQNAVVSQNQSGDVTVTLAGSLKAQPKLALVKAVSNQASSTNDDGTNTANFVQPGGLLTFLLCAANTGATEADDVYIEDGIPESSSFISAKVISTSTSSKLCQLVSVKDAVGADGHHHHVRFGGLKLEPHDSVFVQYSVQVDGGASAPANGTIINSDESAIGSSSTPHTPAGFYLSGDIEVIGSVSFAQPLISTLVPDPVVSTNVNTTANTLTTYYSRAATSTDLYPGSDVPLTSGTNPTSFVPGEERFYIQYQNIGTVPASGNTLVKFPIPANTVFYRASFAAAPTQAGFLPAHLIATPSADNILPPAGANGGFLTSGGTATFVIGKLAPMTIGYAMVEVIVTTGALQQTGSYIGGKSDGLVAIQDTPTPPAKTPPHSNKAYIPVLQVGTINGAENTREISIRRPSDMQPQTASPAVSQVGILRVAPQAVISGSTFDITWVIFNYGDVPSGTLNFEFQQPAGATFVKENHTTLYGGSFVIDTPNHVPATGVDEEVFWNPIPAHSGVAVTYTYQATGGAGTAISDTNSEVLSAYLPILHTAPTDIAINAAGAPAPQGTNEQYSITGRPVHYFLANSNDVFIIDIGGGAVVAEGPVATVLKGSGTIITEIDGNNAVYGAAGGIVIGTTTAQYLLAHLSEGAALATVNTSPAIVLVPSGTIYLAPPGALLGAGGGGLISQDGNGIVAQGGGNVINNGGDSLISQDGNGIVAQGGGNATDPTGTASIVAAGGGNIVAQGGGNIVAQGGGNVIASSAGSAGAIATANGGIVAAGGGNIVAQGGGN